MVGILVILLLAALVGIGMPYVKGLRRLHFAGAALVLFLLIGFGVGSKTTEVKSAAQTAQPVSAAPVVPEGSTEVKAEAPAEPQVKWEYSQDTDQMRGTTAKYASLPSENSIDLDFPYGVVSGHLWVRKRPSDGLNIMFSVEKGQILCNSFTDTYLSIKFDNGPVHSYRCTSSSDGSSETAFIEGSAKVLANLRKAKQTIVEAEFYQKGRQQFVFDTRGLEWK